jgi:hypothetical protein
MIPYDLPEKYYSDPQNTTNGTQLNIWLNHRFANIESWDNVK